MNKPLQLVLLSVSALYFSQTTLGGLNSGGVSNENLMHAVGEIYVIPTNPDQINSGTIGMMYQTVLSFLGVKEAFVTDDVKVFPNPTTHYLNFKISSKSKLEDILIYDFTGKLIKEEKIINQQIDLTFLPSGIYIIRFKNSEIKPIKIIKD